MVGFTQSAPAAGVFRESGRLAWVWNRVYIKATAQHKTARDSSQPRSEVKSLCRGWGGGGMLGTVAPPGLGRWPIILAISTHFQEPRGGSAGAQEGTAPFWGTAETQSIPGTLGGLFSPVVSTYWHLNRVILLNV